MPPITSATVVRPKNARIGSATRLHLSGAAHCMASEHSPFPGTHVRAGPP